MNNKTKPEESSLLRTPKAKNKLGLKIPKIAMPHDDLIVSEKPSLEIVPPPKSLTSQSSHTSHGSHGSLSSHTSQSKLTSSNAQEIAPSKNYQKVPNSITKQAIPDGFFKGKDKHLYDVLYSLTRGSIEPKRKIRISKTKLMKLSGIGSRITFDACIERLEKVRLLKLKIFAGEHEGNEFEILLPEETETMTSQSSHSSQTSPAQKLDKLVRLESSQSSQSSKAITIGIRDIPKTSFKDINTIDDEAFADFIRKFQVVSEEITGKKLTKGDRENLEKLADLLILELKAAASRTSSISSVPAFLTEVLRRKLLTGNSQAGSSAKSSKNKPDAVGKPNAAGEYEKKPLDTAGREAALLELRDFANEDFLQDFEKWYTPEDWAWLTAELDKIKQAQKNEPAS